MPDLRRIVTGPLPLRRGLGFSDLAAVVAADALVRRAWAVGKQVELLLPVLGGDLAGQYAFDRELARDGHDRSSLSPDELDARDATFEEDRSAVATALLGRLAVAAPLGARTSGEEVATAARTAFVKLFEEGLVEQHERVVATCPRCRTPIDTADSEAVEVEGEVLTIRLTSADGDALELRLGDAELLPGAVAVVVPENHPMAGSTVLLPLGGREVPVLIDASRAEVGLLVPAHDGDAYELALSAGLAPIGVLDADGVVCAEGPLAGLARYAARGAARDLLDAEGVLVASAPATNVAWRCRCCGTVLVPQLGRHWFLRIGDLEVAAADAVRDGVVAFTPPDARDHLVGCAGERRDWCLSSQVAAGVPVPAAVCLDCGKVTVDVEAGSSCGKCMGVLVNEPAVLDSRFVAAVWALVLAGWPSGRSLRNLGETAVVVGAADLLGWVLPALALGLRLAGGSPFGAVVVHPWPAPEWVDAAELVQSEEDGRVLRLAMIAGTADLEGARAAVAALDEPRGMGEEGDQSVAVAAAAGIAALDEDAPAQAAGLLSSALMAGVPPEGAERLRSLVLPILGD